MTIHLYDACRSYIVHFFQSFSLFRSNGVVVNRLFSFLSLSHFSSFLLLLLFSRLFSLTSTLELFEYAGEALLPHLLHYHSFSLALSFSIYFESCHYSSLLALLDLSGPTLSTCQACARFVANTAFLGGKTSFDRADADVDVFVVVRVDVARGEVVVTVVVHLCFR